MTALESGHADYLDPHHIYAAYSAAQARYWRRRAQTFLDARPTPEEFHGAATPAELSARWQRLTATADACLKRAEVAERFGPTSVDRALVMDVARSLVTA